MSTTFKTTDESNLEDVLERLTTTEERLMACLERQETSLLIDAIEAAKFLGIGRTLFFQLKSEGRTPEPVKLGKRVLWRRSELAAWVESGCPNLLEWKNIYNSS